LALYSQDIIAEVRAGNDIVDVVGSYVPLKPKGGSHFGLCPFHKEKSPSFSVSADKQMFYCFGCGASGNVIGFVMRVENYGFIEAVKHLADRIHYALPEPSNAEQYRKAAHQRELLQEIHAKAARYYYDCLGTRDGQMASDYITARRVSEGMRRRFGLGYAPSGWTGLYKHLQGLGYDTDTLTLSGLVVPTKKGDYVDRFHNRVMFPIFDVQGKVVGFGGRALGSDGAKYLNSPDTPIFDKSKNLYGINIARQARSEEIILVEGYMDVISLHQAGFANTVAALGTAFNDNHVAQLKKYCKRVILLFDSDEAGEKAALRAIPIAAAGGLQVRVLQLAGAKDPDEFINNFGSDAFAEAAANAPPYPAFQIACARKKYDLTNTEQKVRFTTEAAEIIAALPNSIERAAYVKDVATATNIDEAAIREEIVKRVDKAADAVHVPRAVSRPAVRTGRVVTRGVDEAKRNVLAVALARGDLCAQMQAHITAEELAEPVYVTLYEWITARHEARQPVVAADAVSLFETVEEQNIASIIFTLRFEYDTEEALVQALNDQLFVIKTAYVNARVEEAAQTGDAEAIQKWGTMRRGLKNSYITT